MIQENIDLEFACVIERYAVRYPQPLDATIRRGGYAAALKTPYGLVLR